MTDPSDPFTPSPKPAGLVRRLVPALVVLGASGVAIIALDHPSDISSAGSQDLAAAENSTTTLPPTTVPAGPTTTVPGGRAPSTTTTVAPAPVSCTGSTRTVTGSTITTRFGPVQVAAVVQGKKLCSVTAPQSPNNDRRSQAINAQAIPLLNARATQAGSASFAGVSGATYTSTAYKQSLQSVLDKL